MLIKDDLPLENDIFDDAYGDSIDDEPPTGDPESLDNLITDTENEAEADGQAEFPDEDWIA